jgi:hypothetical protein
MPADEKLDSLTVVNQANSPQTIPSVDINAPLVVDKESAANSVPSSDINAPINIEKITKSAAIPESNLNAALKIDQQKAVPEADPYAGNKKLMFLGALIVVVIIIGVGGFIFLQTRAGM